MTARAPALPARRAPAPPPAALTRPHPWRMRLDRVDPLSAASARPVSIAIAIVMTALAALDTVVKWQQVTSMPLLVVTFAALVGVMLLVVDRTSIARPLWSRASALLVHVLMIVMMAAAVGSTWGGNVSVRDDWAPLVVGFVIFTLIPHRSPRELAIWTAIHTLVAAFLGVLQAPLAATALPAPLFAISGAVAVAVVGGASVAYGYSMNASVLQWERRAWNRAQTVAGEARGGVARSVRQQQISVAGRAALPVLDRVVATGQVTERDRDEAAELAARIRATLVDAVQRTWARELVDDLVTRRPELAVEASVDDADDAGRRASLEQRTLIRAIVAAAMDAPGTERVHLALADGAPAIGLSVRITVAGSAPPAEVRIALSPLIAVARGLARHCAAVESDGALVLEFAYGH